MLESFIANRFRFFRVMFNALIHLSGRFRHWHGYAFILAFPALRADKLYSINLYYPFDTLNGPKGYKFFSYRTLHIVWNPWHAGKKPMIVVAEITEGTKRRVYEEVYVDQAASAFSESPVAWIRHRWTS